MVCNKLRWDKLGKLPSPLTQLHLNQTDWKVFEVTNLKELKQLKVLKIANSKMTSQELALLSDLSNLTHLEVTASSITTIPDSLKHLSHLYLSDNPLEQPTATSLITLDALKKIRLGGNFTRFACDCESPSDFQRWLMKEKNQGKIDDLEDLLCDSTGYGLVGMLEALPGTNESVCVDPTEETKQWMTFVENTRKGGLERLSTSTVKSTTLKSIVETLNELENVEMSSEMSTVRTKPTSTMSTTMKYRKKYKDYDNEPHKFVNVLIFLLFLCVIVLIISIGVTVYLKFWHPEELQLKRRKKERTNGISEVRREAEPLQTLS
uniref:LRRCT domain-containing protein n=1 Tax=Caenorhabditis japonica TaxID=281687 RepID=A0A8R1I9L6_CAEJA